MISVVALVVAVARRLRRSVRVSSRRGPARPDPHRRARTAS